MSGFAPGFNRWLNEQKLRRMERPQLTRFMKKAMHQENFRALTSNECIFCRCSKHPEGDVFAFYYAKYDESGTARFLHGICAMYGYLFVRLAHTKVYKTFIGISSNIR